MSVRVVSRGVGSSLPAKPPIEKPSRSTFLRLRASIKEIISCPHPVNVVGTSPVLLPTPALSNRMTSRFSASLSTSAGSLNDNVSIFQDW